MVNIPSKVKNACDNHINADLELQCTATFDYNQTLFSSIHISFWTSDIKTISMSFPLCYHRPSVSLTKASVPLSCNQ